MPPNCTKVTSRPNRKSGARGNQGRRVVADDGDRKMWIATLCEAWRRTGWRVHAWVLMDNHYHWLLETPEAKQVSGA